MTKETDVIDQQHGKTIIECDSCDAVFEGEKGEEVAVVWVAAKRDGWRARRDADEWLHGCAKCGVPS